MDPKTSPQGLKYDTDKPRMDLIPAEAEIEEALVWGYGAQKYADHNFRKGIKFSKLIAAAKRHINAIQRGENWDIDYDCAECAKWVDARDAGVKLSWSCMTHSGRKHWAAVRCCMGMLAVMEIEHPEMDDRYYPPGAVPASLQEHEPKLPEFPHPHSSAEHLRCHHAEPSTCQKLRNGGKLDPHVKCDCKCHAGSGLK